VTNTLFGIIQSIIIAVIGVLQVFGVFSMTEDQRGAILILWGAISTLILYLNNTYGKTSKIKAAAVAHGESVPTI
jgi:hypothetical protein